MQRLLCLFVLLFCSVVVSAQQTIWVPTCAGTNDTTAFSNIITSIGSNTGTIRLPYKNGTRCAVNNLTIPANVTLDNTDGSGVKINTGQTLTINGPIVGPVKGFFFNALAGQGTVSILSRAAQDVYPEWLCGTTIASCASPSASAAVNTPALQAAIIAAYGNTRTNASGNWIYNRILKFSGMYQIDDELQVYHMIGFRWEGQTKFNSGINQTTVNKRIIDGQSVSYGVFNQVKFTTTVSQNLPLVDLDYSGAQGSDLRPQNITFNDCLIQGNGVGYVGVQIAKSGGGAQGDNIRFYNCYMNGFTQAAAQIGGGADGIQTFGAANAIDVKYLGGDIQSCPKYGLAAYGGNWIVENTSFENSTAGAVQQTGFDIICVTAEHPCQARNIRTESTRFSSGVTIIDRVDVTPGVIGSWYNSNGGGTLALANLTLDQAFSGTSVGGDGKLYKVTVAGTTGGLGITAVASAGASTLTVAGTPWVVDAYAGYKVSIMGGTGFSIQPTLNGPEVLQSVVISSNTADTLTLASPWSVVPDATSTFVIEPNWGTQTTSGTVTFELVDYFVVAGAQKITNSKLVGGKISFANVPASPTYVDQLRISRADAFGTTGTVGAPYDGISYGRFTNVYLIGGPQNGVAPLATKRWFMPSHGGNIGSSLLIDVTQFNLGNQKVVFSGAAPSNPNNRFADIWIGRGDGIVGNSASATTRNVLGFAGILGKLTPVGTDQAGLPTRIQGGLPTGSGAPGAIEWWGAPTPGATGTTVRDGTRLGYLDYTGLHVEGALVFKKLAPAEITANQNNYNPGAASTYIRLTSDASRNITGLVFTPAQQDGQSHIIVNIGLSDIVLKHQDAASTAANRFLCSTAADITLTPKQAADILYDSANQYWLVWKRP